MGLRLEEFGSVGRLKILETLSKDGGLNISQLSRKTGMNHTSVDRHVRRLMDMGLVTERRYGAIRMIEIAFESFIIRFRKKMGVSMELL